MSEVLRRFAEVFRRDEREPDDNDMNSDERRALAKLRQEAKARGATLASGGKGGLPSSMVLGRMRKDKYRCKVCGRNKNLSMHHIGGIVESKRLSRAGHKTKMSNLVTICTECHDRIHEEARERGTDSSQVTPEGDKHHGED